MRLTEIPKKAKEIYSGWAKTSEEWIFDHMITDSYKCLDVANYPAVGKKEHNQWSYLGCKAQCSEIWIANMVNAKQWRLRTFAKPWVRHINMKVKILKIDVRLFRMELFSTLPYAWTAYKTSNGLCSNSTLLRFKMRKLALLRTTPATCTG